MSNHFRQMIYHKMIYQWFTIEKTVAMCISMSSLLPLSGAADRTGCFCLPLEPLLWLADCTLVARYQAYHWSHSGTFTQLKVLLLWSLNSAWHMLHTTLFWQLFRHFASLIETFRPTIPQLSPSSTRSLLADWLQARGGFVSGKTPEVNKVALTALKYFIALIAATLIA